MSPFEEVKVLVVEDDPELTGKIEASFGRKHNTQVESAESCAAARDKMSTDDFEIIALDYDLANDSCPELLDEITSPEVRPSVILVTGKPTEEIAGVPVSRVAGLAVKGENLQDMLDVSVDRAFAEVYYNRAREELRKEMELSLILLNATKNAAALIDRDGTVLAVNEACARKLGTTVEGLRGDNIYAIFPSEVAEYRRSFVEEVFSSGRPATFEDEREGLHLEHGIYPVFDKDGNVARVAVFVRDITAHKKVEQDLKAERDRLEQVTGNIGAGLAIISRDYRTLWANRVLKDLFGDVEGKPCYVTYNQRTEVCPGCGVREVFETGADEAIHEQLGRDARGNVVWSQIIASPIRDREGDISAVLEVVVFITERKRAEEELRKVNAELKGYADTVSHELRTPLTSIKLAGETLERVIPGIDRLEDLVPEVARFTQVVAESVQKAQALIDDLLSLAMAGQEPELLEEVDVRQTVDRVVEEHADAIEERGIRIEVKGDLGTVTASPTHVYQLFSNIIDNAIRHNDSEEPLVRIEAPGIDGHLHRYLVCDNGGGIPPADLENIFLPFFKGKNGDTGIGLATVERIINVYGGEIIAYNDNGTCFEFTLVDR